MDVWNIEMFKIEQNMLQFKDLLVYRIKDFIKFITTVGAFPDRFPIEYSKCLKAFFIPSARTSFYALEAPKEQSFECKWNPTTYQPPTLDVMGKWEMRDNYGTRDYFTKDEIRSEYTNG
ncbi:CLUMA_CG018536, isoform A [Clunio marinus]|uniref:CLUMA_CG018536, isoform A n=1 Tax=Clunio marinus TaxID=568069 RepID=A0A1J1J141_9DIPT|nr:CLUMA_CG018536, isoform A [Clunio marinus]